jgi:hypothetical protein
MSKTTNEATGDTAPIGKEPRTFRDPPTAGYVFAGFGVVCLVCVAIGLFQLLTDRKGVGWLLDHPDRLLDRGGAYLVLFGLGLGLVFCLLPLLFGFETAVVDPARRAVLRRRGLWVRLPVRAVPFAVLERADAVEGSYKGRRFHYVRIYYRDGRWFRLPGIRGRAEAERAARLVNEMLRPVG